MNRFKNLIQRIQQELSDLKDVPESIASLGALEITLQGFAREAHQIAFDKVKQDIEQKQNALKVALATVNRLADTHAKRNSVLGTVSVVNAAIGCQCKGTFHDDNCPLRVGI